MDDQLGIYFYLLRITLMLHFFKSLQIQPPVLYKGHQEDRIYPSLSLNCLNVCFGKRGLVIVGI
jgi:hypothetical protein